MAAYLDPEIHKYMSINYKNIVGKELIKIFPPRKVINRKGGISSEPIEINNQKKKEIVIF